MNRILPLILAAPLLTAAGAHGQGDEQQNEQPAFTAEQLSFFETKVRPLLIERCADCHSGEEPESGFRVDSRADLLKGGEFGAAVKPGRPKQSLLISAVNHNEFLKMPPKEKLSSQQVIDLTRWVEMGAPWPAAESAPTPRTVEPIGTDRTGPLFTAEERSFWAFQPLLPVEIPQVGDRLWPRTPIDYFVLARLEASGLSPAPPADRRTLIRRVTFDLTGLPPTPEAVAEFLADSSPQAYERLIDRLLASPRYGERWGRHWLDVARYADSNGLDENLAYASAFRYRDYVISSFNKDKPYARFAQEQIAGDLLPERPQEEANLEQLVATGFLAIGPKMLAEDDPTKMQMDIIDEQLTTMGQAFLGLTIGCARCHDHKFDPLPTDDYYSLAGIFKSSKTMENHKVVAVWYERPLATRRRAAEIAAWQAEVQAADDGLEALRKQARQAIAAQQRQHVNAYLLASHALDQLQTRQKAGHQAAAKQPEPFVVQDGYALIEAEALHRGNVQTLGDGYGEGIGIIATSGAGFAEYDLEVKRAGEYALEIRYAAADARPLSLLVNGKLVAGSIAGGVTGTWYPDSQRWHAETRFKLKAGKNTIRFDSPRVYPHIDRLALVWSDRDWPFDAKEPPSLTRSLPEGVDPRLAGAWQQYLQQLPADKFPGHVIFRPWIRFAKLDDDPRRAAQAAELLAECRSDKGLGAQLPSPLKQLLEQQAPRSLTELADVYRRLLKRTGEAEAGGTETAAAYRSIAEEISSDASPLSGPQQPAESSYPAELKRRRAELQRTRTQLDKEKPAYEVAMGVTESEPNDIHIHLRGNHITQGNRVPRRMPRILAGEIQPAIEAGSGRLQLARWLTGRDNPLFYRVMANRIWRWRFGRGIVGSVDNFGALGELPTHPRLLEWLAAEFVRRDGSVKEMHRLMLTSSTYRMSTAQHSAAQQRDPENKLLWRMSRRRLSGEEVRDAVLQVGAGIDATMGGSLLKVKNRAYVTSSNTNITDEFDNHRRSVYLPVVRSSVYDVLQTLDFPDPAVSNGDRAVTTVAPQALLMMNSKLVAEATRDLARRIVALGGTDRALRLYQLVLGRDPSADEVRSAARFLQRAGELAIRRGASQADAELAAWQGLSRVLLSSNEFFYVE